MSQSAERARLGAAPAATPRSPAARVMVGWVPQTGQSGSRGRRTSRKCISSASKISRRPTSGSPVPRISLIASFAWIAPDDAGKHAEHAALRRSSARGRAAAAREEAAVAGAPGRREDRGLPLEPEDAAVDVGPAAEHAGVVHQVPGREVVGAVDHEVVAGDSSSAFSRTRRTRWASISHVRVEVGQAARRADVDLRPPDVRGPVQRPGAAGC